MISGIDSSSTAGRQEAAESRALVRSQVEVNVLEGAMQPCIGSSLERDKDVR